jgi:hypothetical protein
MKWNGDIAAPFATSRIDNGSSRVSRNMSLARHKRRKALLVTNRRYISLTQDLKSLRYRFLEAL